MVTTKEICDATGLSSKTLTRWAKAGLIPEPLVRTHPSGRGKLGYWPDWVLKKCEDLVALRAKGHSLQSAAMELSLQRLQTLVATVADRPSIQDALAKAKVELKDGRQVSGLDLALASLRGQLELSGFSREKQGTVLAAFRSEGCLDLSMAMVESKFNPVLIVDGTSVEVVADIMVSHRLAETAETQQPLVVIKLLPLVRKIYSLTGRAAPNPTVRPATAVDTYLDGVVVRSEILLLGLSDFETVHESSQTIGIIEPTDPDE